MDCVHEPQIVDALKNDKVAQISAGCRHAAATTGNFLLNNSILESGKLYTWGFNFYEQLGLGESEKDFD